jgi:hypothetical protein
LRIRIDTSREKPEINCEEADEKMNTASNGTRRKLGQFSLGLAYIRPEFSRELHVACRLLLLVPYLD